MAVDGSLHLDNVHLHNGTAINGGCVLVRRGASFSTNNVVFSSCVAGGLANVHTDITTVRGGAVAAIPTPETMEPDSFVHFAGAITSDYDERSIAYDPAGRFFALSGKAPTFTTPAVGLSLIHI